MIWDNRSLLHRARPYDYSQLREFIAVRVAGDPETEFAYEATDPPRASRSGCAGNGNGLLARGGQGEEIQGDNGARGASDGITLADEDGVGCGLWRSADVITTGECARSVRSNRARPCTIIGNADCTRIAVRMIAVEVYWQPG